MWQALFTYYEVGIVFIIPNLQVRTLRYEWGANFSKSSLLLNWRDRSKSCSCILCLSHTLPPGPRSGSRTTEPWSQAPLSTLCMPHPRHHSRLPTIPDVRPLRAIPGPGPRPGFSSPPLFPVLTCRKAFILLGLPCGLCPVGSSVHFPSPDI